MKNTQNKQFHYFKSEFMYIYKALIMQREINEFNQIREKLCLNWGKDSLANVVDLYNTHIHWMFDYNIYRVDILENLSYKNLSYIISIDDNLNINKIHFIPLLRHQMRGSYEVELVKNSIISPHDNETLELYYKLFRTLKEPLSLDELTNEINTSISFLKLKNNL